MLGSFLVGLTRYSDGKVLHRVGLSGPNGKPITPILFRETCTETNQVTPIDSTFTVAAPKDGSSDLLVVQITLPLISATPANKRELGRPGGTSSPQPKDAPPGDYRTTANIHLTVDLEQR